MIPINVHEDNHVNVIDMLIGIKSDVSVVNTKLDNIESTSRDAENKANKALEIAKKNEDKSNTHFQWWIALVPAVIGGIAGALPTMIF